MFLKGKCGTTGRILTRIWTSPSFETTMLLVTASRHSTRSNTVSVPSFVTRVTADSVDAEKQTMAFNIKARVDFKTRKRARMGVWEAIEWLNTLIDESDPDVGGLLSDTSYSNDHGFY